MQTLERLVVALDSDPWSAIYRGVIGFAIPPVFRALTGGYDSIWITAAIGILIGIGFYFPALIATILTLGTLSVFRWIENQIPAQFYAQFVIRFARNEAMPEAEMRRMLEDYGFTIANLNYRLDVESDSFEYQMVIRTNREDNASRLAQALNSVVSVKEYRVSPTGD